MPILRRRVNRAVKKLREAKKADRTKIHQSEEGPAGLFDVEGIHRVMKAEKKLKKAKTARSKGPVGAVRKALAPKETKNKLKRIQNIKELREKGYVVDKPRKPAKPKEVSYDKSTAHLIKGISERATVRTISKRGNVRDGKLVGGAGGMIFIEMNGKQVPLKADRIKSVKPLKS